jgi:hypothetical protein
MASVTEKMFVVYSIKQPNEPNPGEIVIQRARLTAGEARRDVEEYARSCPGATFYVGRITPVTRCSYNLNPRLEIDDV